MPEIGPSTCFSAPSAPIYNRKRPVWQMKAPSTGALLTQLGCSCFCFVTFRLHNLCPICAFGQKSGLHNPFYACIVQKTVKRLQKSLNFPIWRFTGSYFPGVVPSILQADPAIPQMSCRSHPACKQQGTPEDLRPPASRLLYDLFCSDGMGHFSTSQMA